MVFPHPPPIVHTPDPLAGLAQDAPVVLLPVRVETRWFKTDDADRLELRIRVFPDEIHIAATPGVTAAERSDTAAYYAALANDGADAEITKGRYARLVDTAG